MERAATFEHDRDKVKRQFKVRCTKFSFSAFATPVFITSLSKIDFVFIFRQANGAK